MAGNAIWPIEPVANDHQLLQNFGDADPRNYWRFHNGIDILVTGFGGQTVRAARAGRLVVNNPDFRQAGNGMVVIRVDVGDGNFEYDTYLHLSNITAPAENNQNPPWIQQGDGLGRISGAIHPFQYRHLHFDVQAARPPRNQLPDFRNFLNPLERFAAAADQDPLGYAPRLADSNEDDRMLRVVRNRGVAPLGVISGDVDIIADLRDVMNDTGNRRATAAPHSVGYYIRSLFDRGVIARGVKPGGEPYMLAKFDDNWFTTVRGPHDEWARNRLLNIYSLVYADSLRLRPNPLPALPTTLNYIVTNCNGVSGFSFDVHDRYWRTNAREDNGARESNYYENETTNMNATARFKDGDYEVHIVASDLARTVDLNAGRIRVVNFARMPGVGPGGNPAPVGVTQPLYDTGNTTPFIFDFRPAPTLGMLTAVSHLSVGQTVAVGNGYGGYNFYPDLLMDVYVVPHRVWNQGDSLTTNLVHRSLVRSSSDGTLPSTQVWLANAPGEYDIIVDYDNDGKFSWKLDAVGQFTVEQQYGPEATFAIDDSYSVVHGRQLATTSMDGVLVNDFNRRSSLTAQKLTDPANGSLAFNSDGTFVYQPNAGFVGFDQFTYKAMSLTGVMNEATVLIEVTNQDPVTTDDGYSVQHGQTLTVVAPGLLTNDSDGDGDALTALLMTPPARGSVTVNSNGSFSYTPEAGFAGTDSFTYVARDAVGNSLAPAVVTIEVTGNGTVGDLVWRDLDADGVQDPGEPGHAGVTVTLYSLSESLVGTAVTDSNGRFQFTAPVGDYYFVAARPSGYAFTQQFGGVDHTLDSEVDGTGRSSVFRVELSGDLTLDVGLVTQFGTVSGTVWHDANGNGIQNTGEAGLAGIVVKLFRSDGLLVTTATTDASGNYRFDAIATGNYYLVFERPSGYSFSPKDQGTDDTMDSDVDLNGLTAVFELLANELEDFDVGLVPIP